MISFEKADTDLTEFRCKTSLTIAEIGTYCRRVFEGLQWLHEVLKVAHLDIKPGNFVFIKIGFKYVVKFTDFDCFEFIGKPIALRNSEEYTWGKQLEWYWENCRKPLSLQKEMLATPEIDIYSAGMVVLFLLQNCHDASESMLINEIDGERGSEKRKDTLLKGNHLKRLRSVVHNEAAVKFLQYCLDEQMPAGYNYIVSIIHCIIIIIINYCYY